LRLILLVKKLL